MTAQAEDIIARDVVPLAPVDPRRGDAPVFPQRGTRRPRTAGVATHPTRDWTVRQARHLAVGSGVRIDSLRVLVRDREAQYTVSFDAVFAAEGIEAVGTAARAPWMNAPANGTLLPNSLRGWGRVRDDRS
ncbi:hypothetical protein [Streptomyces incanus]